MNGADLGGAISALQDEVSVGIADTYDLLLQAYQLRYQVYCVERGFLTGQNGVELDEYDDFARHVVVRCRQTGMVIGTVRLVLPKDSSGGDDFPIQHVCDPALLRNLPRDTIGEVSRFALPKLQRQQLRNMSASTCALLRLALIKGAVRLSAEAGHTHWLAVMEPTLLRLLGATGIHFEPLGPPVEYHGLRQPAVAELVPTMARLRDERPIVWEYVTKGGTWFSPLRKQSRRAERSAPALADAMAA